MLVEYSTFYMCTSSGDGGAIYMATGGNCVIHKCCARQCYSASSSYNGQFAIVYVTNSESNINKVNDSSIIYCQPSASNSYATIYLRYGIISINIVNFSNNKCYYYSACWFRPYSSTSQTTCCIEYSSIRDNYATQYTCIYLSRSSTKYDILQCNIINNTQSSSNYGLILNYGQTTVSECTILECGKKTVKYFILILNLQKNCSCLILKIKC